LLLPGRARPGDVVDCAPVVEVDGLRMRYGTKDVLDGGSEVRPEPMMAREVRPST